MLHLLEGIGGRRHGDDMRTELARTVLIKSRASASSSTTRTSMPASATAVGIVSGAVIDGSIAPVGSNSRMARFQRRRIALTPASVLTAMVAKASLPAVRFSETPAIAASHCRAGCRLG
jgi:hypothetical protein